MDPVEESVKSITTILEGLTPESYEESLGNDEGIFKVIGQETILPVSEVRTGAILNRPQGRPEVPSIRPLKVHYALCDWGASVNIMSKMVYDYLDEDPLVPVSWCLQLADSTRVQPYGLVEEVLIEIWMKDRRRRPEGGEWEPIKIPYWNLAYILKLTRCSSLLRRLRPHSCRQAIGLRNRARNHSENTERC
jgi:hypothetical protein